MQPNKAYFCGGGIGSLAGAFFLIRDAHMNPEDITIFEALNVTGGSMDGCGNAKDGYVIRGGRMFNIPAYECFQDLMKDIPTVDDPNITVEQEFLKFNDDNKTEGHARVVDHNRMIRDVNGMGFDMQDRLDLLALFVANEDGLGNSRITEHFKPHFFTTNFWYMWSTTFAFQPWHSAAEFKRYLLRFTHEFVRIQTLEGVARSKYNQYDSCILPLKLELERRGVKFVFGTVVTDIDVAVEGEKKTCNSLTIKQEDKETKIAISPNDIVIVQNGSMCDAATVGSMTEPAKLLTREDGTSWQLWKKLSEISPDFGNPEPFFRCVPESIWQSFTVTINGDSSFFDQEIAWSHNEPGTGALVTFKDSNWMMSIVVPKQPHFRNQPEDCQVFWGYGLFPDRCGNFVNKPMLECNGQEILEELIGHLRFDKSTIKNAICKPCIMPFITAQFMTRERKDRPLPVPKGCTNIGFTSQFVEIPDDVVFTVEYSVRSAQMAIYQLCGVKDRKIPKVHHYERRPDFMVKAVAKSFKGSNWAKVWNFGVRAAVCCGVLYGGKKVYEKYGDKIINFFLRK